MSKTKMTMNYESITPEIASALLKTNVNNRHVSDGTVDAYTKDMLADNWDENVGAAISIDENGHLRDGQHRLMAIVKSGKSVWMWVCRNVSEDGIYDNNRKRSISDQISIVRSDFEGVYRSSQYISVARELIRRGQSRRTVTPREVIDFTEHNKDLLDGFFLTVNQNSVPKISIAVVRIAMFTAYCAGVSADKISAFYEILQTGMSVNAEDFPIIAYRNYLKDCHGTPQVNDSEVARCQYAIKKWLSKSCTKRTIAPNELVYPYPALNK